MPSKPSNRKAASGRRKPRLSLAQVGAAKGRAAVPLVRGRYDAAASTDDNRRHWANADALSAAAALSSSVRAKLRNRCRYEVRNNSYAKGISLTIANDTVGTGPQLQVLGGGEAAAQVETAFWAWAQEIRLAEKLRLMRLARYDSGEVFATFVSNPGLGGPVKLDLRLREAEECDDPALEVISDPLAGDGIRYDAAGNPISYRFLAAHPGGAGGRMAEALQRYQDLPARFVFHYFHPDRPGQLRGIPDITPAVQLFAELRRYSAAVIAAAETAADFAAVLYTDAPPEDQPAAVEALETVELERRMATTLPEGWRLGQIQAEQPTTTYGDFVNTKLKEISRCLTVPFTVASLDSSVANMSSAYVDRQVYTHNRLIDRCQLEAMLERLFELWLGEARLIDGYLPQLPSGQLLPHQWCWPSLGHHADPQKVANAATTELKAGLTTLPLEYAKKGLDWEEQQQSAAQALGLSLEQYRQRLIQNLFPAPAGQAAPDPGDSQNGGGGQDGQDGAEPTEDDDE